MVTRVIILKVIVPRQMVEAGSAGVNRSRDCEVHLATQQYEELLTALRQQSVIYRDFTALDAEEALELAIELADNVRAQQKKYLLQIMMMHSNYHVDGLNANHALTIGLQQLVRAGQ